MRSISASLFPLSDIEGAGPRWTSASNEPWFSLKTDIELAGRWIKIVWRSGLLDPVCRPVIRCISDNGSFDILPGAAIFGANEWVGFIPKATTSINLSPVNHSGDFGFIVEGLWTLSTLDLCKVVFSRAPALGFLALGAWAIGRERDMFHIIRDAIAMQSLQNYDHWRTKRLRRLMPDGVDGRPSEADSTLKVRFVVDQSTDPNAALLPPLIHDLQKQSASNWSLVIISNRECHDDVALARDAMDPRLSIVTSSADFTALAANLRDADLIGWLPVGTRLAETTVAVLTAAAASQPTASCFISDTDRLAQDGHRSDPHFHSVKEPQHTHLATFQMKGFWRVGTLRSNLFDAHKETGLSRPQTPLTSVTLSRILMSLTQGTAALIEAGSAEDAAALDIEATIIIPTRDRLDLLRPCVDSILEQTVGRFRLIVVDNDSTQLGTLNYLSVISQDPRVRIMPIPGPFNFSKLCNAAAAASTSEALVFLNNDTSIIRPDWLQKLISHVLDPDVGAVGAKLLYPNGKVQHAGVIVGMGGQAGHFEQGTTVDDPGYFVRGRTAHPLSAVTGACLAVETAKFWAIGGFDEKKLPIDLNDIDLCLRLAEQGYRTLYVPTAVLIHHESASRGHSDDTETLYTKERTYFRERWLHIMRADPYFSPALSLYSTTTMLG